MDVYPSEWKRVQKHLSCCPSLEALTVDMSPRSYIGRCKSSLQLVNVPKLKKAYLRNVQKIRIEAPALRTLYCEGWIRAKLDLNLIACNNVKELEIKGFRLTKKFFQELNSKFPLLEDLAVLFDSKEIDFFKSLKRLHLHNYSDSSPTVKINCENLRSFKYCGMSTPLIILVNSSSLQETEHSLFNDYQITMRWLLWLRRYVGNFQQNQVLNFWCTDSTVIPLPSLILPANIVANVPAQ
ncbi:hypothetical protein SO802_005347 [Lithocarpus litseifolius]|uniref:Uncharacterized protein n=1 Tax=Lithocarpus litseifolius TaxID=425828 RepID=A0AAW2DL46_9ROSI